jgi:sugar/nucleoside kinase (ribokinase family)
LIDYLVIGHVSHDVVATDPLTVTPGGTVSFSSQTALALGCRTAVLTSAAADFDLHAALPGSDVVCVPAAETTTFSNIYTPSGRRQIVHALAGWLSAENLPASWASASIVHLGPITDRVDPQLVYAFPNSLIGITPQGWMRSLDAEGHVHPIPLAHADVLLPNADAVVISQEDYQGDAELAHMRRLSRILVVTRGYDGCTVFRGDDIFTVPAPHVAELNPTGAGDIFATAFFVQLQRSGGDIQQAAEFANLIASESVTQPDLAAKVRLIFTLTR